MLGIDSPRAACADRLDLVDGAYMRANGPEAHALKADYCPAYPINVECLIEGMSQPNGGVWGKTGTDWRRTHRKAS